MRLRRSAVLVTCLMLAGTGVLAAEFTRSGNQLGWFEALYAEAGSDKWHLLSAQIWLKDIGAWDAMNRAWVAWIDRTNPPARATVQAKLAGDDYLVEIMATAVRR